MSARNHALERRLLDSLVTRARKLGVEAGAFPEAVLERLALGSRRYGSSFADRTPEALLEEVREEALDLAGWSLLLLERLAREPGGVPEHARGDLLRVALLGAVADAFARRVGRNLRDGRP